MKQYTKLILSLVAGLSFTQATFSMSETDKAPSDWFEETEGNDLSVNDPRLSSGDWLEYVEPEANQPYNPDKKTAKIGPDSVVQDPFGYAGKE